MEDIEKIRECYMSDIKTELIKSINKIEKLDLLERIYGYVKELEKAEWKLCLLFIYSAIKSTYFISIQNNSSELIIKEVVSFGFEISP